MNAKDIEKQVLDLIVSLLPNEKRANFDFASPLKDLGFQTLEFAELREKLSQVFDESLHDTFLSRYNTPELIARYFIERKESQYRDWLYSVEWIELPFPLIPEEQSMRKEPWLIFSDGTGFAEIIIKKLNSYGIKTIEVKKGPHFHSSDESTFEIRFEFLEDYEKIFTQNIFSKGISGVIYLWGLFSNLPKEPSLEFLQSLHKESCSGLLNLVKALSKKNWAESPRLFVISWRFQESEDAMALAQWPMVSLGKAVSAECPQLKLQQISFSQQGNLQHSVDLLFLELFDQGKEEQIAWKTGKRLAPRLVRIELPEIKIPIFEEKASYLITGGLSGLGLGLACWYADRGAKELILMDYDALSPESQNVIGELEKKGIQISVYDKFDVGNSSRMKGAFSEIQNNHSPLRGIMHVTGMIDDDLLLNLTWERFVPIFNLKVSGAWNLHTLTKNTSLDHFILFSSMGSTMGPLWRANRASANAFLDALAHYRRAQALPALTINWGPWSHEGMAIKKIIETNIPEGLKPLTVEAGIKVLDHLLNTSLPQVVAAPIDWRIFLKRFPVGKTLFSDMAREVGLRKSEMVEQFENARAEERQFILRKYLGMLVKRVLLLSPSAKLDENRNLSEIGFDEKTLADFSNQLQYDLTDAVELPFDLVKKNISLHALSESLYPLIANRLLKSKEAEYHKIFGSHIGKVVFFTGGSRGIGEQAVRILIHAGASVAIFARDEKQLLKVKENLLKELIRIGEYHPEKRVFAYPCDLSDAKSLDKAFKAAFSHFGQIHYLVNNAGLAGEEQLICDMSLEGWRLTLEANFAAIYDLMIRVLPYMKAQKSGHIVNVGSEFGGMRYATPAYPNRADYAVSKAGARSLAEFFAQLLGPEVQINAVSPGPVRGTRLKGNQSHEGLYLRRARLNLENKRVNLIYNALVKCEQEEKNLNEIIDMLSVNDFTAILKHKNLPSSLRELVDHFSKKTADSGSKTHLLSKPLAKRLLNRLKHAHILDPNFKDSRFFENFSEPKNEFLSETEVNQSSARIRDRIIGAIALGQMPSNDDVAKEIVLSLSNKYITGESIYPSCGLTVGRLSGAGDFHGYFYPALFDLLTVKTVLIVGDSMFEEMANVARAYHQSKSTENIILLVGSSKGQEIVLSHLKNIPVLVEQITLNNLDTSLDSVLDKFGNPDVIASFPFGFLPSEESWENLPSIENFRTIIERQITNHFQIARRAMLMTGSRVFLITPKIEKLTPVSKAFALLVQSTLASLTVTAGDESPRFLHRAVFYQINADLDYDQSHYSTQLVDALLILSLPEKIEESTKSEKQIKRLGYILKIS